MTLPGFIFISIKSLVKINFYLFRENLNNKKYESQCIQNTHI